MTVPRRVVFIHYHLRGGGVSRVLEHQQSVLDRHGIASLILVGEEPPENSPHHDVVAIDGFGYNRDKPKRSIDALWQDVQQHARKRLGAMPDLWHIHNHSLGKNASLPALTAFLAARGEAVVLQPHDFAEDNRPGNYSFLTEALGQSTPLYPAGGRVAYATINPRDRAFLLKAGLDKHHIETIGNAIHYNPDQLTDAQALDLDGRRLLLYPTRAIRRKNVGEVLFWAQVAKARAMEDVLFGLTLAPKNPAERSLYDRWVEKAADLPLQMEMSTSFDYFDLLKTAAGLITTSVMEGFGLAFLEPMLLKKPVFGRALPEVTRDFEETGLDLRSLYKRLTLPSGWVEMNELAAALTKGLAQAWGQYGRQPSPLDQDRALGAIVKEGRVDFGRLPVELQMAVLDRLADDGALADEVDPFWIETETPEPAQLALQQQQVKDAFGLEAYGRRLLGLYETLLGRDGAPLSSLDTEALLDSFLEPGRFQLLL